MLGTRKLRFTPSNSQNLANLFCRRFKRDLDLFHQLKDHLQWDQRHRCLRATSRVQNVDKLLEVSCMLIDEDEIELPDEQKIVFFSVFERNFLTDQGKAIVRLHETDYDSQVACKDLHKHNTNSIKASVKNSS